MIRHECEHSARDFNLGGTGWLSLVLSGDIFSAEPKRFSLLLQFIADLDALDAADRSTKVGEP